MPQASDYLRSKWNEEGAFQALKANFKISRDGIIRPLPAYNDNVTEREYEAIDYLIHEWDYWYETEGEN